MNKKIKNSSILILVLIVLNVVNHSFYKRFDLTKDQRYTLSETTTNIISKIDKNLFITVYLEGDFPSEFKRLQLETRQYLEELVAKNQKIKITFQNPDTQREALIKKGMLPSQLTVEEDGKMSEAIIFPWAAINYGKKTAIVSLLPAAIMASQEAQLQSAIENLEYSFSNAIHSVHQKEQKKIGILSGNGELEDIYQYSFLSALGKKYRLAKFSLDATKKNAPETLKNLLQLDLAIIENLQKNLQTKRNLS